mmetsp:Transcript_2553/g.9088  ORF Transcript_2553/g.9088 Transcript_2553/m.9088 type:complete len:628 (-) Transcript_2553:49-1932(-)|eukprot:CAMPEP_0114613592 /NCGR_PEP_ID=MMETSP0168-20121206/5212_1 /TAXON_ID=95228 ORGANISM="Vannella sp., Strain DIVA3 517/6/12" /NCGR_SAMPLE_ID=MMETSP0168 /ASSEMBLY_ACC=CAM_ASM_000044 /LENGTH=627 /DNA_ID=CAMNT_0001824603 /DNA_START=84 /DNA_END=1967 /DNA_ORIENTATION=+
MADSEPVQDIDLLDEEMGVAELLYILEEEPSTLVQTKADTLNAFYTRLTTTTNTAVRQHFLKFLSEFYTLDDFYDDVPEREMLGDLHLLQVGALHGCVRRSQAKLAIVKSFLVLTAAPPQSDGNCANADALPFRLAVSDLLDMSVEADAQFYAAVRTYVQSLSKEEQLMHLDFATQEVRDSLLTCVDHIANNVLFTEDEVDEAKRVVITLLGGAGVGKSTIVNESNGKYMRPEDLCKEGVGGSSVTSGLDSRVVTLTRGPKEEEVEQGIPEDAVLTVEVEFIDTPGLSREDMSKPEMMVALTHMIQQRITDGYSGKESPISVLVWVVTGSTSRLPEMDELHIRQLGTLAPIMLLWTRAYLPMHIEAFKAWMNDRSAVPVPLPFKALQQVYAREEESYNGAMIEPFGMAEFGKTIASIYNNHTREYHELYLHKRRQLTEQEFDEIRGKAYSIVKMNTLAATAAGGSPLPYFDSFLVFLIQSTMVVKINALFGANLPANIVTTMLSTIVSGSAATTLLGSATIAGAMLLEVTADTMKLVPGLNILGMAISGGMAGALTAALGMAFVSGAEKIAREHPQIWTLPPEKVEDMLMKAAEDQARKTLNDARKFIEAAPDDEPHAGGHLIEATA